MYWEIRKLTDERKNKMKLFEKDLKEEEVNQLDRELTEN